MIAPLLTFPLVVLVQLAPALPPLAEAPAIPAFVPPPVPPPPPQPGTPNYEQERSTQERRYREQCYSAAGIKLLMAHWAQQRAGRPEGWAADRAAELEVAEAAFANPPDVDRLDRALRARAAIRAERDAQRDSERLALLRSLPAPDRLIYASEFSAWRPARQAIRVCPG